MDDIVTITQIEAPSRSKQAGPCWIRVGAVYAATKTRAINAAPGDHLTAEGKVMLRRATRASTDRDTWRLTVTGDPADQVTLSIGVPQAVTAVITGVRRA